MDMIRYLNRIQFTGQIALNPEALRDLHLAHMFSVPFENLDIWLKR
jgi:N-hydroxyarylamine O-acetyltransferase